MSDFSDQISAYRSTLVALESQMQSAYDKAVMTLSGGALAVSMTFVKDIADKAALRNTGCLLTAWIMWGLSVAVTLASFYTSSLALRKAIRQTDEKDIYTQAVGGVCNRATAVLNPLAGFLFFLGVVAIVVFVGGNVG